MFIFRGDLSILMYFTFLKTKILESVLSIFVGMQNSWSHSTFVTFWNII